MAVDQSEILKEAVATLEVDAALIALLGEKEAGKARIWNHVPQDDAQPYVVVRWQADEDWDTKDSTGFDGSLDHEAVSNHHGDKVVLQVVDAIIAAYKAAPLALVSGRITCFEYQSGTVPVQVLETHRAIASFSVLVDADGVGGVPIDPPEGGLIVVQDEDVDLDETPHRKLNFKGDGVTAVDAGGGVAEITIPGGGGGGGTREVLTGFVDLTTGVKAQFNITAAEATARALALRFWISPKGANHGAATSANVVLRHFSNSSFSYAEYNTLFQQWNPIRFPSYFFKTIELSDAADEGDDRIQVDDVTDFSIDDLVRLTTDGTNFEFQAIKDLDKTAVDLIVKNTILKPGVGAWPAGSEVGRVFEVSDQVLFKIGAPLNEIPMEAESDGDCRLQFALFVEHGG